MPPARWPPYPFMNDQELKSLLQETHPVLPGQEARAWRQLEERLAVVPRPALFSWRPLGAFATGVTALILIAFYSSTPAASAVSASSQSPGIFATAFYSKPAHAQVVWLNGMEPVKDGPTYMDRTGKISENPAQPSSPDEL